MPVCATLGSCAAGGVDERGEVELLVTTGMLTGDGDFDPHGHVVRIAVRPT